MADSRLPCFLFGLGVGAAVGLLYAPRPGDATREDLLRRADEGRDYLRQRSTELRDRASDLVDKGREGVNDQRDQLAAALEAGRRAYGEATRGGAAPSAD
jgi:gas vesicle protein